MTIDPNVLTDDKWAADGPPKGVRVRLPIAIVVVAVVALIGVWGGAQLKGDSASATVTSGRGAGGFRGYGGFGGGGGAGGTGTRGGGATVGTVQSVNGNTITVTDQSGATKTITLDSGATVTKTTTGSASDITPGETIIARGTTNSDGSTSAQAVSIGNPGAGFFGGGGPPPDAASSGN